MQHVVTSSRFFCSFRHIASVFPRGPWRIRRVRGVVARHRSGMSCLRRLLARRRGHERRLRRDRLPQSPRRLIFDLFSGRPFTELYFAGGRDEGCQAGDSPTKTIPRIMDPKRRFSCRFGFTLSTMFPTPAVVDTPHDQFTVVNVSLHAALDKP